MQIQREAQRDDSREKASPPKAEDWSNIRDQEKIAWKFWNYEEARKDSSTDSTGIGRSLIWLSQCVRPLASRTGRLFMAAYIANPLTLAFVFKAILFAGLS